MTFSREELVAMWQAVELALATTRLSIDFSQPKITNKMRALKGLSQKLQSEIRFGDRHGWETEVVHDEEEG